MISNSCQTFGLQAGQMLNEKQRVCVDHTHQHGTPELVRLIQCQDFQVYYYVCSSIEKVKVDEHYPKTPNPFYGCNITRDDI